MQLNINETSHKSQPAHLQRGDKTREALSGCAETTAFAIGGGRRRGSFSKISVEAGGRPGPSRVSWPMDLASGNRLASSVTAGTVSALVGTAAQHD